jgi:hypothetical protein
MFTNETYYLKFFTRGFQRICALQFLRSRMTESVGNNENLNDFGTTVMKTHFRLSALTELTGEFDYYHQRVIFVLA